MAVINNPAGHLLSGVVASGAGSPIDCRQCANYGYLVYNVTAASARVVLEVSHDNTGWMTHSIYTAVNATATAQITDYLPYVRAGITHRYGASTAYVTYSPGLK